MLATYVLSQIAEPMCSPLLPAPWPHYADLWANLGIAFLKSREFIFLFMFSVFASHFKAKAEFPFLRWRTHCNRLVTCVNLGFNTLVPPFSE